MHCIEIGDDREAAPADAALDQVLQSFRENRVIVSQ
jgi:hypothetical protein